MRHTITRVLASAFLLLSVGCSDQHDPIAVSNHDVLKISTSLGDLTAEPPVTDVGQHRRTVSVHLRLDQTPRAFQAVFERDPAGFPKGTRRASILDADGQLLWEYRIRTWVDGSSHLEISERTSEQELRIHLTEVEGGIEETYELNGRSVRFSPGESDSERASRFRRFYEQPRTLDANPNGLLLTEMLGSAEFRKWIRPRSDDIMPNALDPDVEEACKWAERALVKCGFGGWLNPLCHAAVGTTIACWIADATES